MNGPTMAEPFGAAPRTTDSHYSRCSIRCRPELGVHCVLVEATVADLATMQYRHLGRHVTLGRDQNHAPDGTEALIAGIEAAVEHGVAVDPEYPYVWLTTLMLDGTYDSSTNHERGPS